MACLVRKRSRRTDLRFLWGRRKSGRQLYQLSGVGVQGGAMTRETQDVVGGILLIICLGGLQWWCYRNGISMGPFPLSRTYKTWRRPVYRETNPRSFWLNTILCACLMLVFFVVVLKSMSGVGG